MAHFQKNVPMRFWGTINIMAERRLFNLTSAVLMPMILGTVAGGGGAYIGVQVSLAVIETEILQLKKITEVTVNNSISINRHDLQISSMRNDFARDMDLLYYRIMRDVEVEKHDGNK